MTVSTEVDHNDYTGNGVTTAFPYHFRIFKSSDLTITTADLDDNQKTLILGSDYTVTGVGSYQGGDVVLSNALSNGWKISVARVLPVTQETDLRNQGKFFAEVHENAFDKLTMLVQQCFGWLRLALCKPSFIANYYDALNNRIRNLQDPSQAQDAATKNYVDSLADSNLSHTLRTPEAIPQLPGIEQRKNKIVAMDNSGNPLMVVPESGSAADVLITLGQPGGAGYIADIAKPITWFGGVSGEDCSDAFEAALNSNLPFFFPDGVWIINSKIEYTGSVNFYGLGNAIIKSDKMFEFTDSNNSSIKNIRMETITVPFTLKRNTTTWNATASDVTQSRDGYQPTALDEDIWTALSQSIKDQAIYRTIECGIKFFSSTTSGINGVNIENITGYGVAFELYGTKNSTVSLCHITGNSRDAITFINDRPFNGVNLPRGEGNQALNNTVKYASQCGVCWWGQNQFRCDENDCTYNGESGIKIYQYDTNHPSSIISTESRISNCFSAYNYYDGIDAQVWYPPATDPGVISRNTIVNNISVGSRHTGITSNGGHEIIVGNSCRDTGATGIRVVSYRSVISGNSATNCANASTQHAFQIFGISVQGDGILSSNNRVNNTTPAYTYDYIHTGVNGQEPASGDPGIDTGNTCSGGISVMHISNNITSSMTDIIIGAASKLNTFNAALIVRKLGYGADVGGGNAEGYVHVRGDATAVASYHFSPVSSDPSTIAPKGTLQYNFPLKKIIIKTEGIAKVEIGDTSGVYPTSDNSIGLGLPTNRWTQIYAANGAISTSDGDLKCYQRKMIEAELATARDIKGLIRAYKFKDAVEAKGENARTHFGVIAQDVVNAFSKNGLDAFKYGVACYDEWPDSDATYDKDGNLLSQSQQAGCRYGIRYEQLFSFIIAAL